MAVSVRRVLDTTVLIDVLRGYVPAVEFLAGLDELPACSEITRLEIMRGLRSGERGQAERVFQTLDWIPVDEHVSRAAGEYGRHLRRSHGSIDNEDLIVAASAEILGGEVATSNTKDFPMFPGLKRPYRGSARA